MGPLRWPEEDGAVPIIVMVDGLSRYVALTLAEGPTSQTAIKGLRRWCDLLGTPQRIVSDQGPAFIASHSARNVTINKLRWQRLPPMLIGAMGSRNEP